MSRQQNSDEWLRRLRTLQGEFRPSLFERWQLRALAVILIGSGGYLIGLAYRRYPSFGNGDEWLAAAVPGVIGAVFLALGAYAIRSSGYWYRFGLGQVQLLSRSGSVLWEEDLSGAVSATFGSARGNDYLKLRWPQATHFVTLYDSLATALEPPEPADNEEADSAGDTESSDGPAGPPWRCKYCGEENPGNFGECWKCDKLRGD